MMYAGIASFSPGTHPVDLGSVVDVSFGLEGDGSKIRPWRLTEYHLQMCCRKLNWTTRTIFFRPGIYYADGPLRVDFDELFPNEAGREMLREGVAFRGVARASMIVFEHPLRGMTRPALQIFWGRRNRGPGEPPRTQTPLFFWEFTGLNVKGNVDHELVRFGGEDIEETPFNSCVFQISVNNGYVPADEPTDVRDDTVTGPARGVHFFRVLESTIDVVATCAQGMAAVFDTCEFCTIKGSFSNAECVVPSAAEGGTSDTGRAIRPLSHGLYFIDCCGIANLSINLEVCFFGISMERGCRGITFANVMSNNCDVRGSIFNVQMINDDAVNQVECLVRRQVIQGGGRLAPICEGRSAPVKINHVLR